MRGNVWQCLIFQRAADWRRQKRLLVATILFSAASGLPFLTLLYIKFLQENATPNVSGAIVDTSLVSSSAAIFEL